MLLMEGDLFIFIIVLLYKHYFIMQYSNFPRDWIASFHEL